MVELASPESILALTREVGTPTPALLHHGTQDVARLPSKDRRIRCKCGRCRQCLDNARWERIVAEKFADPNYYNHLVTHMASPMTSH